MAEVQTAADRTIDDRPTPGRRGRDRANGRELRRAASRRRNRCRVCPHRRLVRRGRDRLRTTGHWIPSPRRAARRGGDRRDASRRDGDRSAVQPSDRRLTTGPSETIRAGLARTRRGHSGRVGRPRPVGGAGRARSVGRTAADPPRGSRTTDAGPWARPANRGRPADPRRPWDRDRAADWSRLDAPGRVPVGAHRRRPGRRAWGGSRSAWDAAG